MPSHRSEEHTSELQSHLNLVYRLLLRSEEHTSELQSHLNLVCRLLLVTTHLLALSLCLESCIYLPTSLLSTLALPSALPFFSKEHPSALQSHLTLVYRLLL